MVNRDALSLTWFDIILIAGIAIASFWAGRAASAFAADHVLGIPSPSISFEIRSGVPSDKDSLALVKHQQDAIEWQIALTQITVIAERQELMTAPRSTVPSMQAEIRSDTEFLTSLQRRQEELERSRDKIELALASDEYHAQRSRTRSSSIRRVSVWGLEAAFSFLALALLSMVPFLIRLWAKSGVHPKPVIIGSAIVLLGLLFTVYASWVGLALIVIVIIAVLLRRQRGQV